MSPLSFAYVAKHSVDCRVLKAGGIRAIDAKLRLRFAQNDKCCTNSMTIVYPWGRILEVLADGYQAGLRSASLTGVWKLTSAGRTPPGLGESVVGGD